MELIVGLLVRFVVFGIALTFAMKRIKEVKVEPKHAVPLVALIFALLNALLYWLLAAALNLVTLWSLFFIVPFVANGLLLWVTDRYVKYFKIEGLIAFVKTAGIVTLAHALVWLAEKLVAAII